MSLQNFTAVHLIVVEVLQSGQSGGPTKPTNIAIPRCAGIAKKEKHPNDQSVNVC